ncbi:MAG: hypothetical protein M0R38_03385 [Bacteroidia bacterium]|nr:hypothetical protein [Bacteroidia bacterium]
MKRGVTAMFVVFVAMSGCKEKEPKITSTLDISPEMKSYFVDYEIGTKWIYEDSLNHSSLDTIELIKREPYDTNRKGVLEKGYILHYKARKSRDFKVSVSRGQKVNFYIKMYTDVTGSGYVSFENYDGEWGEGVTYFDSIEIRNVMYYDVLRSETTGGNYYLVHVSKNMGLVSYIYMDYSGGIAKGGYYKLIKTEKP